MRREFLLLRPIYHLLYHQFAWSYDRVADLASLGQWKGWVRACLPYLQGRVLELGYGPGHLQMAMRERGLTGYGLDESRSMAQQASRRLRANGGASRVARGLGQSLPFPAGAFDTVVSTFPAMYIFQSACLAEIRRVLSEQGRLVILPMAWITGPRPVERLMAWLMRVSGEAPGLPRPLEAELVQVFRTHGFRVRQELMALPRGRVLLFLADKAGEAADAAV